MKAWGSKRIRYPCSPRPKRCTLAIGSIDPSSGVANALNVPPGKYDRKIKTQRNRREFAQAVDHVVQFDTERKTSPGFEIQLHASRNGGSLRGCWTGAARLSSARQVTGSLKWGNERNPRCVLQVSHETARVDREEGGDDVKSAWPFDALGYTHDTMDETMGCQTARWS